MHAPPATPLARSIVRFNDDLMEAHLGPVRRLAFGLLLACLDPDPAAADGDPADVMVVVPAPRRPHPEGGLGRTAPAGRAIAVPGLGRLHFARFWVADYKVVLCADRIAIRLGFSRAGGLTLVRGGGGGPEPVTCLLLDRCGAALGLASGLLELGV